MMSAMTPPPMYISYLGLASGTRYALSISTFGRSLTECRQTAPAPWSFTSRPSGTGAIVLERKRVSLVNDANDVIRDLFRRLTSEGVAGGVAQATDPVRDPLDQLKKLAELREMEAITATEFEEHKARLLAKLARDVAE